ncbi:hypothetical protein SAMN04488498_104337 [Mesorhizobium albiziae]|uniref:Uncharacterized protein n=1 Tax=Neomesorhizobium albiziae TaxID=335020 RepID=A0A1I3YE09_9HYPH|nr:hypothetical protein [Mesorhizobium albiziae]GLS29958.1 hypothetical protein GCM10007937_16660 [Mesorhizobium albiziae]SFK29416.1 hypothetical protein SAMN04488498_104337 [Mesorhizobium albiziae]
MGDATVALSRTYTETGKPVSVLQFRGPRWQDFVDLGEIEEWQPIGDQRMVLVRHHDVVAKYAERCVKEPSGAADLAVLDLADTIAVHEAIRDFFVSARSSRKQLTDSSGDSEKASTKSGA